MNGKFNTSDFYIDSGATMHMTPNKEQLTNLRSHEITQIEVANKTLVSVEDCGKMNFKTVVDNIVIEMSAKEVLCIPKLSTKLLSVSQLTKRGYF